VLGGAELTDAKALRPDPGARGRAGAKFSENALDATDAFAHYASEADLDGVPADVKAAARAAAEAEGREGYKLTLQLPCYLPVMQFAKSSALRELLYRAYVTRASEQAEGDARRFDNGRSCASCWHCARKKRRCWATPTSARYRWCPRWPTRRPR
jgi:oligopeptidase A